MCSTTWVPFVKSRNNIRSSGCRLSWLAEDGPGNNLYCAGGASMIHTLNVEHSICTKVVLTGLGTLCNASFWLPSCGPALCSASIAAHPTPPPPPRAPADNKFSSFQRQLNLYGFRKIVKGRESGCYMHPSFLRDRPDLLSEVRQTAVRRQSKKAVGTRGAKQGACAQRELLS